MNSMRSGLTVAAVVLGTMTAWAGIKTAGNSGSAVSGTAGYAITVPSGDRWQDKSDANGAFYENRYSYAAFYRAGFSAAPAPAFSSRNDFLAYVKQAVAKNSDTSGYQTVRDSFTEKEQDGLWVVDCSLNRDEWELANDKWVAANAHDSAVTRIRTRYALDPLEPGRVIVAWYAWHGVNYDERRFESEAATLLNSLHKTSQ